MIFTLKDSGGPGYGTAFLVFIKYILAAFDHILIGGIEISGVPGICHVIGKEHLDLAFKLDLLFGETQDAAYVAKVPVIHYIDLVKVLIVCFGDLTGSVGTDGNAFFQELLTGRRVDGIPDLLPGSCCGIYFK